MGSLATQGAETTGAVHRVHIPLRLSDFMGMHVNNVRYQEFSQDARMIWFRQRFDSIASRIPFAMVRWMEIDFRRTIGMDATEVWVDIQVLKVGRTSFTMRTAIGAETVGPEPCAIVDAVLVVTEPDETTTLEISPEERRVLLGDQEEAG